MKSNLPGTYALIMLFTMTKVWAQLPDTLWTKIYPQLDDSSYYLGAIGSMSDNGFALAGYFYGGPTTNNGALLKADSTGEMQWLRTVVGPEIDMFKGVIGTSDGGVFACGEWEDPADGINFLAAKYTATGDTEWIRMYDQAVSGIGYRVLEIETSEFVITGEFDEFPGIVKLTPDGELVFMRSYIHPWHSRSSYYRIAETYDHGFIIVSSILSISPHPSRLFLNIIRTDSLGDTSWTRTMGFWARDHEIWPHGICRADSNTYMIAVDVNDPGPDYVTYLTLLKLTDQGDTLWSRRYEFPEYSHINNDRVTLLSDQRGGFLVSATYWNTGFGGGAMLFKVNEDGNLLWAGTFRENWDVYTEDFCVAGDGTYLWLLFYQGRAKVVRLQGDTSNTAPEPLRPLPSCYLGQNYPNPFNSRTEITYSLLLATQVTLKVYDVLGREVAVLVDEIKKAGEHRVKFDAVGLASGVYLCRIEAGEFAQTRKMVLLK